MEELGWLLTEKVAFAFLGITRRQSYCIRSQAAGIITWTPHAIENGTLR